ncbi:ZSC20 protein, partial [Spizella passerina]|nr:ZSC20 protein [Spizella passerina]
AWNVGKSFSQRSHLICCQKIHTWEQPHKCLKCGKDFSDDSNLIIHRSLHTGEQP